MHSPTSNKSEAYLYKCDELPSDSDEYKLVKSFFDKTIYEMQLRALSEGPGTKECKIYKIIENHQTKTLEEKRNNLMLFHGTNKNGVEGILKEGFKNSKEGWFGPGVYMTDCSDTACRYCDAKNMKQDFLNPFQKFLYNIFVNEVLQTEKLQIIVHDHFYDMEDIDTVPKYIFEKHVLKDSKQPTEDDYKKDVQGRRYRNVIIADYDSSEDEYVADKSIVIPRYLIKYG